MARALGERAEASSDERKGRRTPSFCIHPSALICGDAFVVESAHVGEELIGEDADVGLFEAGRAEDVNDLAFDYTTRAATR